MINWNTELITSAIISVIFLVIFAIAEVWRIYGKPYVETTRKFVHLSSGAVALSFSYIFKSHWSILVLCILFVSIIIVTKKYGLLKSIHAIERKSSGGIYYPIAIYLTFLFAHFNNAPHFYFIAILILAVSDSLAALVGNTYGIKPYNVEEDQRSIEGSVIFFVATFLIAHLGLLLLSDLGRIHCVLIGIYVASLVTAFESISLGGFDNLFIPIGTSYILIKITTKPLDEIIYQTFILFFIFILILIILWPRKKIGITGIIGIALLAYGAWSLVGYDWFIPLLTAVAMFSYLNLFSEVPKSKEKLYRIRTIFYIFIVSLLWTIVANVFDHREHVFLIPFLINIAGNLSIFWERKSRLNDPESSGGIIKYFQNTNYFLRAVVLTIIFVPIQFIFDERLNIPFSLIAVFAGIILADRIFWVLAKRTPPSWDRIKYLRLEFLITLFVSNIALAAGWILYYHILIH